MFEMFGNEHVGKQELTGKTRSNRVRSMVSTVPAEKLCVDVKNDLLPSDSYGVRPGALSGLERFDRMVHNGAARGGARR